MPECIFVRSVPVDMMWEAGICAQLSNESLLRHLKKWFRYVPKAAALVKANESLGHGHNCSEGRSKRKHEGTSHPRFVNAN